MSLRFSLIPLFSFPVKSCKSSFTSYALHHMFVLHYSVSKMPAVLAQDFEAQKAQMYQFACTHMLRNTYTHTTAHTPPCHLNPSATVKPDITSKLIS